MLYECRGITSANHVHIASSAQQQSALLHYWTGDLQQSASSLRNFVSYIEGSPILLPFDATSTPGSAPLVALINSSTPQPFPPPLACYPGLTTSQVAFINDLEASVFGLDNATTSSSFDSSCFPNRPVYGVLDILQLRLPFSDARSGVAKQAASLVRDAYPRVVVYSGEAVSALPGPGANGPVSLDPHDYGTMNHMNHVILKYLRSLDFHTAMALVSFVLDETGLPPTPSSTIFGSVPSLPLIEVAVFGSINTADITSVVSAISNSTGGGVFFGTTASQIVRNWTIDSVHQEVVWAQSTTSPLVERDSSYDNSQFNDIWENAWNFFHVPNKAIVYESNITGAFAKWDLLSP